MEIVTFTGGIFDTNCYLLPGAQLLIDAPQGAADWLREAGIQIQTLLLTHGHIDHVWDAARIQREHGCKVGYHRDDLPMLTEPDFFAKFGFNWEIEPVQADCLLDETEKETFSGCGFKVLHVPGHCPGSICFFDAPSRTLFGGDVLFAGSVGRTDLPGGNAEQLFKGIREKVYPLGDDVKVYPGHGPATTVGRERMTNPFVR